MMALSSASDSISLQQPNKSVSLALRPDKKELLLTSVYYFFLSLSLSLYQWLHKVNET
jgi:hypothetical protein